jgi:hypothetical protein
MEVCSFAVGQVGCSYRRELRRGWGGDLEVYRLLLGSAELKRTLVVRSQALRKLNSVWVEFRRWLHGQAYGEGFEISKRDKSAEWKWK